MHTYSQSRKNFMHLSMLLHIITVRFMGDTITSELYEVITAPRYALIIIYNSQQDIVIESFPKILYIFLRLINNATINK